MPSFSTEIKLNGRLCLHNGDQFRGTLADGKANSYLCPLGMEAGRVWLIMRYADIYAIHRYADFTLSWRSTGTASNLTENLTVKKLYLSKVQRLFPGGEGNPDAAMLVELEDRRALLNRFSDAADSHINWRSYASDELYLDDTINAGVPYTWAETVEVLWNLMPVLGQFPGLPYAPSGVPTNFTFQGSNAWKAMHTLLHKLDCDTRFDPFAETFSIVRLGVAQQPPGNLPNPPFYKSESSEFTNQALITPEMIRVYFDSHYEAYGQERDTERATNWLTTQGQYIEVATGVAGAAVGTIGTIHDDLFENIDETNTISNQSDLAARAAERVANFVRANSIKRKRNVYQSLQKYLPGPEVKATWWRNFGIKDQPCGGTVTEVIQYPGHVKPIADMMQCNDECGPTRGYPLMPSDMGRRSYPNYPRLPNIVQVRGGSELPASGAQSSGSGVGSDDDGIVRPNDDGFYRGIVRRWVGGTMEELEECWILFVDDYDVNMGNVPVQDNDYFYGRLSGKETSGGITLPIYLCRAGNDCTLLYIAELECDLCDGDTIAYFKSDPEPRKIGCCSSGPDASKVVEATPDFNLIGRSGSKVIVAYDPPDWEDASGTSGSGACGGDPFDAQGNIKKEYLRIIQIEHEIVWLVTDQRVCESQKKLIHKRYKVAVPWDGTEKELDWHTGEDCEEASGSGSGCDLIDSGCDSSGCPEEE